ncbi:MAG: hypothetical protein JW735_00085, partial [Prolixibacteraceae bacterium]|nr:hypothetical protein [Prolixibacteraceae bacterium]
MKYFIPVLLVLLLQISSYSRAQGLTSNQPNSIDTLSASKIEIDNLLVIEDVSPELSLEGRKPLLLIHGWSFEGKPAPPGGGFWKGFKDYLLADTELRANFKPYYVKYWSNEVSVKDLAIELRKKVEEAGLHEQKIAIIGHSMGGLVSRSYINENTFTQGIATGQKCGEMVDLLITLGSPHHGSPMANNKVRNAKFSFPLSLYVSIVEAAVFNEIKYNEPNRSDLRWDNYDALFDYNANPDEANDWLVNLNRNTKFDNKHICYTASVTGVFKTNPGTLEEQYQLGAYLIEQGFNMQNDGIVPVESAEFEGHTVKNTRHFNNYNHADIVTGKEGNRTELFSTIDTDLMDVAPLKLTWPAYNETTYIKHAQQRDIRWEAPSTIEKINIYLSINNGESYEIIAQNIDASTGAYSWYIPSINETQCLIKITNAQFETEQSVSPVPFTIFYNRIDITEPSRTVYFVKSKSNTIKWEQTGLGDRVKISFTNKSTGEHKVIAQSLETSPGENQFVWQPDLSLQITDTAIISIELLNMLEKYGDSQQYVFESKDFKYIGEQGFTLMSPLAVQPDTFGIEGEKLVINSIYNIDWMAEGEIKYVALMLCDSNKNIIEQAGISINSPSVRSEKSTRWYVPDLPGNNYYFLARAGLSSSEILFEVYSEKSFRINHQAQIINITDTNAVDLQPCFEFQPITGATSFHIGLTQKANPNNTFSFDIENNTLCLPKTLDYELIPGEAYQIMGYATLGDTLQSYEQIFDFKAAAVEPMAFEIIAPTQNEAFETENITATWVRAVGAAGYSVEMKQNNELLFATDNLNPADTSLSINITEAEFYQDIDLKITAINDFGDKSA